MSNIQLYSESRYSPKALEVLPPIERRIVVYSIPTDENPRICDMTDAQFEEMYKIMHFKAATRLGTATKSKLELKPITDIINEDLQNFHPTLTKKEFYLALDNGLIGMYKNDLKDFVHFSPSHLMQWIRRFIDETKTPVMGKIMQIEQSYQKTLKAAEPSEEEKLRGSLNHFKWVLEIVMGEGRYEDSGNVLYLFLEKINMLPSPDLEIEARFKLDDEIDSGELTDKTPDQRIQEILKEMWDTYKWEAVEKAKKALKEKAVETKDRSTIRNTVEMITRASEGKFDTSIITTAKKIIIADKIDWFLALDYEDKIEYVESIENRVELMIKDLVIQ